MGTDWFIIYFCPLVNTVLYCDNGKTTWCKFTMHLTESGFKQVLCTCLTVDTVQRKILTGETFDGYWLFKYLTDGHCLSPYTCKCCIVFKQFDGLNFDGLAGKRQKRQNFPPSKFCAIQYAFNSHILIKFYGNQLIKTIAQLYLLSIIMLSQTLYYTQDKLSSYQISS